MPVTPLIQPLLFTLITNPSGHPPVRPCRIWDSAIHPCPIPASPTIRLPCVLSSLLIHKYLENNTLSVSDTPWHCPPGQVCAARQCSEDLYPENARLFGRNNHSINNRLKSLSSAVLCQLFLGEEVPLGVKKLLKANVGRFVNPTGEWFFVC